MESLPWSRLPTARTACSRRATAEASETTDTDYSGTLSREFNALTPENERSTHYFFTAIRFGVKTTDEKLNLELQKKIAEMQAMVAALSHLTHHCHGDQRPDCPILEDLARE